MRISLGKQQSETGYTLTELSIVVAIISAMSLMIMPVMYRAMSEAKADDFGSSLIASTNRLNDYAQVLGTYEGVTVAQAISHSLLDPGLVASASSAVNPWGYAITITPGYVTGSSYYNSLAIGFSVPKSVCGHIVTKLESQFWKVTVAGTAVKSAPEGDRSVKIASTATACATKGGTIELVFHTSL
jgi:prepilin-type N-terminal cleavage/methylation domain-containing protein